MQNGNDSDTPVIGKHILSTLTIGMYQDPRMIYREYIQKSADQIDTLSADERRDNIRQTIVIDIDERKRVVEITDKATGIPRKDFRKRLLNVADSQKDPSKNKGFRGIGRLAGLNYCRMLIFEASAKGETVVSRLEMDAHEMIRILHDVNDHSLAGDVIKKISKVSYTEGAAKEYDCYFKVTLLDVRLDVGKQLLDIESVKEFVAQIAPVPFSNLSFRIGKDIMVACIGIACAVAVAVFAAVKSYPMDYNEAGELLVDGAKMANDTYKGVGWCVGFLIGWILEKQYVKFSTDIPMMTRITRLTTGLLSYYAVSLILNPLFKSLIPGVGGTVTTCFIQMFYVTFVFPLFIKLFEHIPAASK